MVAKQSSALSQALKSYSSALLSMVFPNLCVVCANHLLAHEKGICKPCENHLPMTNYHLMPSNAVERIFWGRVKIEYAASHFFYRKGEGSQKILASIKYKGNKELGERMGELMGESLVQAHWHNQIDCIVPVPLHPKKQISRGFNQSEVIAKGLSKTANIPTEFQLLKRLSHTETQTRKGRYDRFTNMNNAFGINHNKTLPDKHFLLVDDVITTGGTLEACACQLLSIPNAKVSILTLGYATV
jgi:ComF family protein